MSQSLKALGDLPKPDLTGKSTARGYVENTPEFRRIYDLPRRPQGIPEWMVEEMTQWLKTPEGTWSLRVVQAQALRELYDYGGTFVAAGVGHGKTLISLLAPVVVGAERPTLVVPAALRDKTIAEAWEVYADHWQIPRIGMHDDPAAELTVISYEMLGIARYADWLDRRSPDLLIFDEVHKIKNRGAAVTRRVSRYMAANPDARVVAMSGTVTQRSLRDFSHVMSWCLKPEHTPLPQKKEELEVWARAVDRKVDRRPDPGALKQLIARDTWDEAQSDPQRRLAAIREGVYRRLSDTPAVAYTTSASVEASIYLSTIKIDNPDTRALLDEVRETKLLDDDELLPQDVWRVSRQIALGFYYRWEPQAPPEWMRARKLWRCFVRDAIGEDPEASIYDSELVVAQAVDRFEAGKGGDPMLARGVSLLADWRAIRGTFEPNPVPQWFTSAVLEQIAEHLRSQPPTLVWVEHRCVGERLSALLGVPFFANKGRSADGQQVEAWDRKQHAVLSIAANCTGRNLQAWNRNLIVTPMPNGGPWQQLMGRTHRQGQEEDEVFFDVVEACNQNADDLSQARADALYIQTMTGEPQKLVLATKIP